MRAGGVRAGAVRGDAGLTCPPCTWMTRVVLRALALALPAHTRTGKSDDAEADAIEVTFCFFAGWPAPPPALGMRVQSEGEFN